MAFFNQLKPINFKDDRARRKPVLLARAKSVVQRYNEAGACGEASGRVEWDRIWQVRQDEGEKRRPQKGRDD